MQVNQTYPWRQPAQNDSGTAVMGSPATVPSALATSYTDIDQQDDAAPYILISDAEPTLESEEEFQYTLIPTCRMDRHVDDERNITEIRLSYAERVLSCRTEEEAIKLRDILDAKIVTAQLDPGYAETLIHEPEHQQWRRRYNLPTDSQVKRCKCGALSQQVCARAARKLAAERDAATRAATEWNATARAASERNAAAKAAAERAAAIRATAERDAAEKAAAERDAALKVRAEREAAARAAAKALDERDAAAANNAAMKAAAERHKEAQAMAEKAVAMVAADTRDRGANAAADESEAEPSAADKDAATKTVDQRNAAAKSTTDSVVASKDATKRDATATAVGDGNAATRTSAKQTTPMVSPPNQSVATSVSVNGSAKTGAATAKTTTGSPATANVAAAPIVIDLTLDDDDDESSQSNLSIPSAPFSSSLSVTKSGSAIVSVTSADLPHTSANAYIPPHLRTGAGNSVTVTSQLSTPNSHVSVTSTPAPYLAPHMRDTTNTRTTLKSASQSHKSVRFNPIERRPSRQTAAMPSSSWLETRMSTRSSTGASASAAAVTIRPATGGIVPVPIAPPPNYDPTGSFRYSNGHNQRKTGYVIKEILRFDTNGRPEYRQ
ncbi:hypothetical protein HDU87_004176 [Geranomyces variabilis]|uniref:Uncharacterized protein n=1 Tax=Geranomyces variabilis TaxID=109894 RepID=A0AAD5TP90_9FUNG|nr:hypothetical protein HDU87_004176 [Geranomyces variabilis]